MSDYQDDINRQLRDIDSSELDGILANSQIPVDPKAPLSNEAHTRNRQPVSPPEPDKKQKPEKKPDKHSKSESRSEKHGKDKSHHGKKEKSHTKKIEKDFETFEPGERDWLKKLTHDARGRESPLRIGAIIAAFVVTVGGIAEWAHSQQENKPVANKSR